MSIVHGDRICQVVDYHHVKPGKGGAFVRAKLRDIRTGQVIDYTWKGEQKVEQAILNARKFEYLYSDGSSYVFMDIETYEQIEVGTDVIGAAANLMRENTQVELTFHENAVVGFKLPDFVALEVVETDPGVKGDTATGGSKPATLETGCTIQVPLFIGEGEKVKVDTRTVEYVGRA